ncbi:MAG: type IV secretion system DNA-binding domain-containing protein [bacterium]
MPYSHNHEDEIIVFAETNFRNTSQKFGIKTDDRRRHVYILGKTGMGKTTMIENMILEDIYAGHGVGFVDPHGDSSDKILNYIPSHRVNDVVYFNPADVDNPMGFNVLEAVDETHKHLIASGLMGVFKKIWEDQWSARMEYILNNTILALLDYPGSTLLGINRLLSDKEYRKKVIAQSKDPVVKAFWVKEFAGYQQKFASEAVAPIQNKVGQFLSASVIRNIVAQVKSTIDIRKIMDEGKIFIMNLSKGKIGEDSSRLLGGMLITKLQLSAMERVDMPEPDRMDFYLYVDEFQNFATSSFADILSEARKYRLNLILAHQYIAQLDEKVRDAVFGNVGTHIVFRVGAADAAAFEEEFTPVFLPEDLVNLPKYDIYLKLMIDGAASQPFSARTLPPIGAPTGSREKVINVSRERYSQKRSVIEEKIERWWGFGETETAEGSQQSADSRGGFSGSPPPSPRHSSPYQGEVRRGSDGGGGFSSSPPARGGVRGGGSYSDDRPPYNSPRPPFSPPFQGGVRGGGSSERGNPASFPRHPAPVLFRHPARSDSGDAGSQESQPPPTANYQLPTAQFPAFPAVCDRCGKETTANFKPDPRKPFYCQDCLPLMREKMRLQSSSPPPSPRHSSPYQGEVRRGSGGGESDFSPSVPSSLRGALPAGGATKQSRPSPVIARRPQADEAISSPMRSPRPAGASHFAEASRDRRDDRKEDKGLSLSALVPRSPKGEVGLTPRPPKAEKPEKEKRGGFSSSPPFQGGVRRGESDVLPPSLREAPPSGGATRQSHPTPPIPKPLNEGEDVEL